MTTPQDGLRAAAAKLRDTSKKVTHGPPWTQDQDCPCCVVSGDLRPYGAPTVADRLDEGDASWIALVHPGLAEPLAAWLDFEAGFVEDSLTSGFTAEIIERRFKAALAVARALNGSQS